MKHAATAILFAALLGGCAQQGVSVGTTQAPLPASQEVYGVWVIAQARSAPIIDKSRARLVLGRDGRVSGHDSCNPMKGTYTLQGDRIKFGPIATGRITCVELYGEQSDRILSALELAATARVRPDGLLEIRDADGSGLLRATREVKE
ncbi:META domain-containing protein [Variovorax sp. YR752]|uniref:META domain-containing protein n=1 Tax=Variovorax sp. YR752 TaxID=1884383 RepID=UPI003137ADF8